VLIHCRGAVLAPYFISIFLNIKPSITVFFVLVSNFSLIYLIFGLLLLFNLGSLQAALEGANNLLSQWTEFRVKITGAEDFKRFKLMGIMKDENVCSRSMREENFTAVRPNLSRIQFFAQR
jgi:ATP/ADP translocase